MPKKKGGKKGAKIIDGVATNEMTREQLMSHLKRIQTELNREREERNFFMLEREKLYALWNLTIEQLSTAKRDASMAYVTMDECDKEREREMQIYKQKVRWLMTQQWKGVTQMRLHQLETMKKVQEKMGSVTATLRQTISAKNEKIKEAHTAIHDLARNLSLTHKQQETALRSNLSEDIRRLSSTYERLLFEHEATQRIYENAEVERTRTEKWETVKSLVELHESQITEMKNYFHEICLNNLGIISTLQSELEEMKGLNENLSLETEQLKRRCEESDREKSAFQQKLEEQERKLSTRVCGGSVDDTVRRLQVDKRLKKSQEMFARRLEVTNEILLIQKSQAVKERDELKHQMVQSFLEMQRKSKMSEIILKTRLLSSSTKGSTSKTTLGPDDNNASFSGFKSTKDGQPTTTTTLQAGQEEAGEQLLLLSSSSSSDGKEENIDG